MTYRIEHDLLGEKELPSEAYYGIHTLRASENFKLSGIFMHSELIISLAYVKKACCLANLKSGRILKEIADVICKACDEIISGKLHDQFIVDVFQGGAGTSANMNANEVIANRALELMGYNKGDYSIISPIDHVNLSQSTNDVFPTAVKLAAIKLLIPASKAMANLQKVLQEKENEFSDVLKVGRTEMQDAVPITLGQEFSAYAQAVQRDWWRLYKVEERIRQINLGGTAIGTGLNADLKYIYSASDILRDITGVSLARAENMIDSTQNLDVFVEVSGLVKSAAVNLLKISSDLRFLSCGPLAGIGEITLPALQAGSSIMPGKVNPVALEAVSQAGMQIIANDLLITQSAASGNLELNAFLPILSHNLFQSLVLLKNSADLLAEKCIKGIVANRERCNELVEKSLVNLTALTPYIGYESASKIAKKVLKTEKTVRETALEEGYFTQEEIDVVLSSIEMTKPGVAGIKKIVELRKQKESK
ncbi:MAG: aspartate ammonia-lyase [Armatimonadota bacterium]